MLSRIQEIINLPKGEYSIVWDLCCDHGKIGMGFLKMGMRVHFVDRVSSIIDKLVKELKTTDIPNTHYKVQYHNILRMKDQFDKKDLIILSGIGGYLIEQMLTKLHHVNFKGEILICAHQNVLELRKYLSLTPHTMLDEKLIKENGKFYELILLKIGSTDSKQQVQAIGSKMWSSYHEIHDDYIQERLSFLKKKLSYSDDEYLLNLQKQYTDMYKNKGLY